MNRTNLFWRGLTLLLMTCFFVACQITPTQHGERQVADENSRLLRALVQESDFAGDLVVWDEKRIRQYSESPTSDNQHLVESAMNRYAGNYGSKRYSIGIDHILKRYEQQAPAIKLNTVKTEQLATVEVLNLSFPPVGEELAAECTRLRDTRALGTITCLIEVKYPSLLSFLLISAPNAMDVQEFQKLIEPVLLVTDARIKALDR